MYLSLGRDEGFGYPQAAVTENGEGWFSQCSYQAKGAWMVGKMKVIGPVLETAIVPSESSHCLRKCSLFVDIPTIT